MKSDTYQLGNPISKQRQLEDRSRNYSREFTVSCLKIVWSFQIMLWTSLTIC